MSAWALGALEGWAEGCWQISDESIIHQPIGVAPGNAGGAVQSTNARRPRFDNLAPAYYPGRTRKDVEERIKWLEAQARKREAEDQALIRKADLLTAATIRTKMREIADAIIKIENELAELYQLQAQWDSIELNEALEAYEKYSKYKKGLH